MRFAAEEGIVLSSRGQSGDSLTLGDGKGTDVIARFSDSPPFLIFTSPPNLSTAAVSRAARRAEERVSANDFGGEVWFSFELQEQELNLFAPHSGITALVLRLGTQVRITGWRRLGPSVLLEFSEGPSKDGNPDAPLLAPPAIIHVHVAVPGPREGFFAQSTATGVVELVAAICTFALGRPVNPPSMVFPAKAEALTHLGERNRDETILTLARKSISLDIISALGVPGGFEWFSRLRAALITFDAAMRQERDSVASILYVVAAESLTVPKTKWRDRRLSARFREFYLDQIAADLDTIVQHGNFEAAFSLKRGRKTPLSLRKKVLDKIYDIRSGHVHEGLPPSYKDMFSGHDLGADMQRALIHDFSEAALLSFIRVPRSSLVGHPILDPVPESESAETEAG